MNMNQIRQDIIFIILRYGRFLIFPQHPFPLPLRFIRRDKRLLHHCRLSRIDRTRRGGIGRIGNGGSGSLLSWVTSSSSTRKGYYLWHRSFIKILGNVCSSLERLN